MEKELEKCIRNFKTPIPNIEKYLSLINTTSPNDEKIKQVYSFIKEISPYLYQNGHMKHAYTHLVNTILDFEYNLLPNEFIIFSEPLYTKEQKEINLQSDPEQILSSIVNETRRYLIEKFSRRNKENNINKMDFANYCNIASKKVKELCDEKNIKCEKVIIHPGYSEEEYLYNGNCYHFINIVYINEKRYLIDCTYRQFFTLRGNMLERIGIVNLSGCKPGVFMLMTENRKKVADKILKDGWIELTDSVLKDYLDGFSLSFRNGLYYEQTNDFSFTTPYSASDYIRFLSGIDDQVNHEGNEVLGYQKKPLKKSIF